MLLKNKLKLKGELKIMENKNKNSVLKNGEVIINCTPHPINIKVHGEVIKIDPTPEYNIKLSTKQTQMDNTVGGLSVHRQEMIVCHLNDILPEQKDGTIYIVPLAVIDLCRGQRADVYGINNEISPRNEKGWIEYIAGLIQY